MLQDNYFVFFLFIRTNCLKMLYGNKGIGLSVTANVWFDSHYDFCARLYTGRYRSAKELSKLMVCRRKSSISDRELIMTLNYVRPVSYTYGFGMDGIDIERLAYHHPFFWLVPTGCKWIISETEKIHNTQLQSDSIYFKS